MSFKQENYNTRAAELQSDVSDKFKRESPKKVSSLKLSESLHRQGLHKKANRVYWCAHEWIFAIDTVTGEEKLHDVNFCRERLCPMCAYRRSKKIFRQVSDVMNEIEKNSPQLVPVFLTLTLKSCSGKALIETLDIIFQGWYRMTKHRKIQRIVPGWFRALEVTYNKKDNSFHPHIHAILLVDKTYFTSKDYMQTSDWVQMWRKSLRINYDPVCDIRKVKKDKNNAVAEVAKYTVKDNEYITSDEELTDKLVGILNKALKSRRLFSFGGLMKETSKNLGIKDNKVGDGDLVHIDGEQMRSDIDYILRTYRWNMGLSEYVQIE